jgi:hypothetical protein
VSPYGISIVGLVLLASSLSAQRRFDVTPLFGFRGSEPIPLSYETPGSEQTGDVKLAPGASFAVAAGIRYDTLNVIEFRWTRQSTEMTNARQSTARPPFEIGARLDQYHGDFTREYELEEHRLIRPFIIGSVGATRLTTPLSSFTRMSFGLGGGVKVFPTSRFGIRMQAQWLPLWLNPKVEGFVCGGGCIVVLGGRLAHQAEVSIGPVFSF